jgi:hypothetical protein
MVPDNIFCVCYVEVTHKWISVAHTYELPNYSAYALYITYHCIKDIKYKQLVKQKLQNSQQSLKQLIFLVIHTQTFQIVTFKVHLVLVTIFFQKKKKKITGWVFQKAQEQVTVTVYEL